MPPYPLHTSCTLSVDIPRSKNVIMTSFNDMLNGIAKETTQKYIEMMEYLNSLLPTASTKVSANVGNDCSLPDLVSQPKSLECESYARKFASEPLRARHFAVYEIEPVT